MDDMNKTYIPALVVLVILSGLHFAASAGGWYVRFHGFDILMHIIGGMGLAFAMYWMIVTFLPKYLPTFWHILLLTFLAGVAWELFEAVNGIAGAPVGTTAYYIDTIKDLVDDTLGAIVAALYISRK